MTKQQRIPIALTIAGSDSGGGAGVQADLKTFQALAVHGTSVLTCVTAQNPKVLTGIQPCSPDMILRQLDAVFSELPPKAAKTGMLYSASIIHVVADYFRTHRKTPLVVDPVLVSTSGTPLLKGNALRILEKELLPLATLITPNLDEAALLTGRPLKSLEDLRRSAREIQGKFGCAVLVKGGHLKNTREAADIFFDGTSELLLTAPFVGGMSTHGTGCTYSAAVAALLAYDHPLSEAVAGAKEHITQAIANSQHVGRHWVLNPGWNAAGRAKSGRGETKCGCSSCKPTR